MIALSAAIDYNGSFPWIAGLCNIRYIYFVSVGIRASTFRADSTAQETVSQYSEVSSVTFLLAGRIF